MGKGVDRHLFALNTWAGRMIKESSSPSPSSVLPAIFTNEAYRRFKDIRLSTSTLASDALDGGGEQTTQMQHTSWRAHWCGPSTVAAT